MGEVDLAGALLGGLGYAGDLMDKTFGGRALRGGLSGNARELASLVPFSDTLGLTDKRDAVSGQDLAEKFGLASKSKPNAWNGISGFALETILDPSNLVTAGGAGLLAMALRGAGKSDDAARAFRTLKAFGAHGDDIPTADMLTRWGTSPVGDAPSSSASGDMDWLANIGNEPASPEPLAGAQRIVEADGPRPAKRTTGRSPWPGAEAPGARMLELPADVSGDDLPGVLQAGPQYGSNVDDLTKATRRADGLTGYRSEFARALRGDDQIRQIASSELPRGATYLGGGVEAVAFRFPDGSVARIGNSSPNVEKLMASRPILSEVLQPSRSAFAVSDSGAQMRAERLPYAITAKRLDSMGDLLRELVNPVHPKLMGNALQLQARYDSDIERIRKILSQRGNVRGLLDHLTNASRYNEDGNRLLQRIRRKGGEWSDNHWGNYGYLPRTGNAAIIDPGFIFQMDEYADSPSLSDAFEFMEGLPSEVGPGDPDAVRKAITAGLNRSSLLGIKTPNSPAITELVSEIGNAAAEIGRNLYPGVAGPYTDMPDVTHAFESFKQPKVGLLEKTRNQETIDRVIAEARANAADDPVFNPGMYGVHETQLADLASAASPFPGFNNLLRQVQTNILDAADKITDNESIASLVKSINPDMGLPPQGLRPSDASMIKDDLRLAAKYLSVLYGAEKSPSATPASSLLGHLRGMPQIEHMPGGEVKTKYLDPLSPLVDQSKQYHDLTGAAGFYNRAGGPKGHTSVQPENILIGEDGLPVKSSSSVHRHELTHALQMMPTDRRSELPYAMQLADSLYKAAFMTQNETLRGVADMVNEATARAAEVRGEKAQLLHALKFLNGEMPQGILDRYVADAGASLRSLLGANATTHLRPTRQ